MGVELTATSVFDKDSQFWEQYLKGRPTPPEAFFKLIFDYHASKNNSRFETVHDCGAGVGVHSVRISAPFAKTLVSDASAQNIAVAKDMLLRSQATAFEVRVAKAEETAWLEAGSVDVVFAANFLHLADVERALEAVDYQLRSGGTFAATLFGVPYLHNAKAQEIWYRIWQTGFDRTLITPRANTLKEGESVLALAGVTCVASFYDAISLSGFEAGALRYKLNVPNDDVHFWYKTFVAPGREDFAPFLSQVQANDVVVPLQQAGWEFRGDLQALKDSTATFPMFEDESAFEGLWKEMSNVIGDETIEGVFPASLLLATKK